MSGIRPPSDERRQNAQTPRPSAPSPPVHLNALFGPGNRGFIVFKSEAYGLIQNASTIEAVIHELLQKVPLSNIGTAFVHYPSSIEDRLYFIDALRHAGFKNIQGISPLSLTLSAAFIHVDPQHFGERAMIVLGLEDGLPLDDCKVSVIEKCDGGWKVIVENLTVSEALEQFPTVMDVILWERSSLKEQLLPVLTAFLGKSKRYSLMKDPSIEGTYVQQFGKHVSDSLPSIIYAFLHTRPFFLGSKIVLPYCDIVLSIVFGTENVTIPLVGQNAPFTVTKEIDIGTSTIVKVRGTLFDDKAGPTLLKTFTFGKSMPRKVLLTVEVDKTLLPEVTLMTIGTNQGEDDVKVTSMKAQAPKAISTPNLSIEFGDKVEVMDFTDQALPFGQQKEFDVGDAKEVVVFACSDDGDIQAKSHIKTLQFEKKAFRKVAVTVLIDETRIPEVNLQTASTYKPDEPTPAVDLDPDSNALIKFISDRLSIYESTMPMDFHQLMLESIVSAGQLLEDISDDEPPAPQLKLRKSKCQRKKEARQKAAKKNPVDTVDVSEDDEVEENGSTTASPKELPPPKTILTFTTDNRVQIQASETYTGEKELLAYVCLQDGKKPMVGKDAFDALSTHPETVFYDVTRLLATDFDPNQPNPSWAFKATRNADGKIVVRGASGIATYPIIVFGLIVRSTLLYIQTYQNSEVAALGIRFLAGSTINDADLKELSKYVGVQLVLV